MIPTRKIYFHFNRQLLAVRARKSAGLHLKIYRGKIRRSQLTTTLVKPKIAINLSPFMAIAFIPMAISP